MGSNVEVLPCDIGSHVARTFQPCGGFSQSSVIFVSHGTPGRAVTFGGIS